MKTRRSTGFSISRMQLETDSGGVYYLYGWVVALVL